MTPQDTDSICLKQTNRKSYKIIKYELSRTESKHLIVFIISHCQKNVTCHHEGAKYVHDHCNVDIQTGNISQYLRNKLASLPYTLSEQIIKAILFHTNFTVQHNIFFLSAENLLFEKIP